MKPLGALSTYLRGVKTEFKKVHWPTKERFLRSFLMVVVSVVVATLVITAIDATLQYIIKQILL